MTEELSIIEIKDNKDHGYLTFLKKGLAAYPFCFKLSPEDRLLLTFPTPDAASGFTLGALMGGQLVGVVTFTAENARRKQAHIGEVSRMYVCGAYQGKKVGYRLLQKLLELVTCQFPQIRQVRLNVATHNEQAKRLYRKLGFTHYATEKDAIRCGDTFVDDDSMVLFLN